MSSFKAKKQNAVIFIGASYKEDNSWWKNGGCSKYLKFFCSLIFLSILIISIHLILFGIVIAEGAKRAKVAGSTAE